MCLKGRATEAERKEEADRNVSLNGQVVRAGREAQSSIQASYIVSSGPSTSQAHQQGPRQKAEQ